MEESLGVEQEVPRIAAVSEAARRREFSRAIGSRSVHSGITRRRRKQPPSLSQPTSERSTRFCSGLCRARRAPCTRAAVERDLSTDRERTEGRSGLRRAARGGRKLALPTRTRQPIFAVKSDSRAALGGLRGPSTVARASGCLAVRVAPRLRAESAPTRGGRCSASAACRAVGTPGGASGAQRGAHLVRDAKRPCANDSARASVEVPGGSCRGPSSPRLFAGATSCRAPGPTRRRS